MNVSLLLLFLAANQVSAQDIGAECNPTGDPIGGGPGYSDSVRHQDADFLVYNASELFSALACAGPGDIVYVWDSCHINMNDHSTKLINPGVTLASGRGRTLGDTISWGALIYYDRVNDPQWEMFRFCNEGGSRITGLRFRGSYSCLEGRSAGTSFPMPVAAEAAICINKDSTEIDNCEFWGFGYCPIFCNEGTGSRIHHNYLHHGNHVYHGYGITVCDEASVAIEANYWDYYISQVMGGSGAGSLESHYTASFNIGGGHSCQEAFDRHYGANGNCAADQIHHNTVRFNGYPCSPYDVTGVDINGYPVDSVFINNNWFWDVDSAHSIQVWDDPKILIWDNYYGEDPPPDLAGTLPVANINASTESGNAPLTVTFDAIGSYDPNGSLHVFSWNFGDSSGTDNYARYTDINKTVQHTFDEIGIYRVELMVTDDDGITAFNYCDINVTPGDGRSYLSLWVKDRYHDNRSGFYAQQILLDDWKAWEKDVAGEDDWEHVILDVTDSLIGKDSINIIFRLYCTRDTSEFQRIGLWSFIDDVVLYGGNVINGNFESGTWTGTWNRSDGNWSAYKSGNHYYCWDWRGNVRSGISAYALVRAYNDSAYAGTWVQVSQKVGIEPVGTDEFEPDEEEKVNMLHIPFPNPSRNRSSIAYTLAALSKVSLKIYDTSGRLVKTLADGIRDAGYYQLFWDGFDNKGFSTPNGVYFCRLEVAPEGEGDKYKATQKLVVLK